MAEDCRIDGEIYFEFQNILIIFLKKSKMCVNLELGKVLGLVWGLNEGVRDGYCQEEYV